MSGKFNVEIPDQHYWKRQIKCQNSCPVNTDSRGYVRAIAAGDYKKAYLIARAPNPLASICGRICAAPCEAACRRSDIDDAVTIRALKRFVTGQFGPESGAFKVDLKKTLDTIASDDQDCSGIENIRNFIQHFDHKSFEFAEGAPSVGIIGSGPAGLAAAHDLCLMGVKPVIYEMESVPAGMLYLGIPAYRLPRELIMAEVEVIKSMGTEIICNVQVGKDISFSELRKKHKAVLIAVGAKNSRSLPIPGVDAGQVRGGVEFLRDIALNNAVQLGERVLVIGGGNVAYDVARTLVRQTDFDISQTALRQQGVKEVNLVCLESFEEMPADTIEIEEGQQEGVILHNSWGPREILRDDSGRVTGVRFVKCLSIFDENKRFSPKFDEGNEKIIETDNVFLSIGQTSDLTFIDAADVTLNERGLLNLSDNKLKTAAPDVFAAGDVATGPGLMIDAIASGKKAAREMYAYIHGLFPDTEQSFIHDEKDIYHREEGYEFLSREHVPVVDADTRKLSVQIAVEKGFNEHEGKQQAARCLDCAVNTIFDSDRCILCGGCVDVCPEGCLKLVSADNLGGDAQCEELVRSYFEQTDLSDGSAIIKDETRCIRCAHCADRCPVEAITMEAYKFKESFR